METTIVVTEQSQIAEVRRAVNELALRHGMTEADTGRASLVATETATNLVKYGERGVSVVSWFEEDGACGIQIIAADHGPGFANFNVSARDGHSTGGSLGIGLGTLMRTADSFDHYSVESAGAVIFTRIAMGGSRASSSPEKLMIGSRTLPKPGQVQCGDGWAYKRSGRWQRICMVDGLGHGPLAALATREAIKVFDASRERDSSADILTEAHARLKATRGVVMAVISIDTGKGEVCFSGVGNIAAVIFSEEKMQHLPSIEGTIGYIVRSIRQQQYEWKPASTLVMNTDGLAARWNLARTPGLLAKHPALVAAVMHRDFARNTDDSTILVARQPA